MYRVTMPYQYSVYKFRVLFKNLSESVGVKLLYPGLVPVENVSWMLHSKGGEARTSVRTRR